MVGTRSFGSDHFAGGPACRGGRCRAAVRRRGGLRQALPRARQHRGRLAPVAGDGVGDDAGPARPRPARRWCAAVGAASLAHDARAPADPDSLRGATRETLSPAAIAGLLHGELGSTGIVICDALEMRGRQRRPRRPQATVLAVIAGAPTFCAFGRDRDEAMSAPCAARARRRGGIGPAHRRRGWRRPAPPGSPLRAAACHGSPAPTSPRRVLTGAHPGPPRRLAVFCAGDGAGLRRRAARARR